MESALTAVVGIGGAVLGALLTWSFNYLSEIQKAILQKEHFAYTKLNEYQFESIKICFGNLVLLESITNQLNQDYIVESTSDETYENHRIQKELLHKAHNAFGKFNSEFWSNSIFIERDVRDSFIELINSYDDYLSTVDLVIQSNYDNFYLSGTQNQPLPEFDSSKFYKLKINLIGEIESVVKGRSSQAITTV